MGLNVFPDLTNDEFRARYSGGALPLEMTMDGRVVESLKESARMSYHQISNDCGVHMRPMPGNDGIDYSTSKDKKKAAPVKVSDVKRISRDHGELQDIMFKLFERQPNWALQQPVQETDQPAQFLKERLNELCVYNERGTNQRTRMKRNNVI